MYNYRIIHEAGPIISFDLLAMMREKRAENPGIEIITGQFLVIRDEDGHECEERVQAIYIPALGLGGVYWACYCDSAIWTDAESLADLGDRFFELNGKAMDA